MARPTKMSESPAPGFPEDLYGASPPPPQSGQRRRQRPATIAAEDSPSPNTSVSSDKENTSSRVTGGKGKEPMGPPRVSASEQNKRKRPTGREPSLDRTRRRRTVEQEDDGSDHEYDPDQSVEVRRQLRKGLRDLTKNLQDNRTEYLDPRSTGIRETLEKADELSNQVKQTSDATIDARLLVQVADASYKKALALTTGDTSQGIDIEDFISKVKTYMRGAVPLDGVASATQRRRRADAEEDDEDIDGDMLDWEYLGRNACVKHTLRPSVPGFLLGPLSVEKRAKRVIVRKAAFKPNAIKETRPEVVKVDEIEKNENANLSTLCLQIATKLHSSFREAMLAVEEEIPDDATPQQGEELCDHYGISTNGGYALFKFVINPHSFGQTVENLFYTSFLIRDGVIGIEMDDRGLPYLKTKVLPGQPKPKASSDHPKHQAILALDMATWRDLIDTFDIKESIIPHREEEEHNNIGKTGWYA